MSHKNGDGFPMIMQALLRNSTQKGVLNKCRPSTLPSPPFDKIKLGTQKVTTDGRSLKPKFWVHRFQSNNLTESQIPPLKSSSSLSLLFEAGIFNPKIIFCIWLSFPPPRNDVIPPFSLLPLITNNPHLEKWTHKLWPGSEEKNPLWCVPETYYRVDLRYTLSQSWGNSPLQLHSVLFYKVSRLRIRGITQGLLFLLWTRGPSRNSWRRQYIHAFWK